MEVFSESNEEVVAPYLIKVEMSCYKAFSEQTTINFTGAPGVYLIIGTNASGKTAVLEGIAKCLSWVSQRVIRSKQTASTLSETAINTKNDSHASAHFKITIGKNYSPHLSMRLSKSLKGAVKSFNNEVEDTEEYAKKIREKLNENDEFLLPLWLYYGVERNNKSSKRIADALYRVSAYERSLDGGSANWSYLMSWLELCFDKKAYQGGFGLKKVKEINEQINSLQKEIESLRLKNELGVEGRLFIKAKQDEIDSLRKVNALYRKVDEIKSSQKQKIIDGKKITIDKAFEIFLDKTRFFLEDVSDITVEVQDSGKVILVKKTDNSSFEIDELSQGEKSILALLGDLIRRMTTLNPHLENPLETPAVVLVDEIDLHLHPQWQQRIVAKLEQTFPKTQFLFTTHSPIVLSSVVNKNVFILHKDSERGVVVHKSDKQSKGSPVNYNLANFQDTDESIKDIAEYQNIVEYLDLVEKGQHEGEEGESLKKRIVSHFGVEHPFWLEVQTQVFLKKRKSKLHEKAGKTNV